MATLLASRAMTLDAARRARRARRQRPGPAAPAKRLADCYSAGRPHRALGHPCGGQPQGRESGRRIEYNSALLWREVRADEGASAGADLAATAPNWTI